MSFLSLLAVLFIGLKLASVITWAWYLVLIPVFIMILIRLKLIPANLV